MEILKFFSEKEFNSILTICTFFIGSMLLGATSVFAQTCNQYITATTPDNEFTDHSNGTVTHSKTGLMWAKCSEGQSDTNCETGTVSNMTWANALNAASNSTLAGFNDWRLPNKNELASLQEKRCYSPSINSTYFPGILSGYYWSSSPHAAGSSYSWIVDFSNGDVGYYYRNDGYAVRLVRSGQLLFLFSLVKQGVGGGTVTSDPVGLACGSVCDFSFHPNTVVKLTATAAAGSVFAGWGGACSGSTGNVCTVTMNAAKSATATFNLIPKPTVTTNAASNLTPTSAKLNGTVISSNATANVSFYFGTTTTYGTSITATPSSVYSSSAVAVSANKTGLSCGTVYHYRVKAVNSVGTTLGADKSFTTSVCPTYTVTPTAGSGGAVSPNTPQTVNQNAVVSFTVTANNGYSINTAITGTCPQGSWSPSPLRGKVGMGVKSRFGISTPTLTLPLKEGGNVWTTGAITANCYVNFSFTQNPIPINGVCGSANSNSFNTAPTANLCNVGTASAVTGTGPWTWTCPGSNGGTNASCTANINRYTVNATAGTGGTVNSSNATVNYGTKASFTVTANSGYTRNNVVGGTCPPGNWNGNVWTTGTIVANCSVSFSFTPPIVTSYTVTASANLVAGIVAGSFIPEIAQTVTAGTRTSFTVTANEGYSTNTVVTGTCPQGNWNTPSLLEGEGWDGGKESIEISTPTLPLPLKEGGNTSFARSVENNVWTTGPITANCTVIFGFTAVTSWLAPPNQTVIPSYAFTLDVTVKSTSVKVGQYTFVVTFDPNQLRLDTTYTNATGLCINGVCPGANALANRFIPVINNDTITLNGNDPVGKGPGNDLQLLVIHFKSRYVLDAPSFVTGVTLQTNLLTTIDGDNIGTGARGASVNVSTGLCGDATGDTFVNIIDALGIARKLVGLPPPPTVDMVLADVNEDGRVAITDALHIARYSVGLVTPPEVCKIGLEF